MDFVFKKEKIYDIYLFSRDDRRYDFPCIKHDKIPLVDTGLSFLH